jgi:hypothetical protein
VVLSLFKKKPLVITTIVVAEIAACPAATVPCRGGGYAMHITPPYFETEPSQRILAHLVKPFGQLLQPLQTLQGR